MIDFVEGAAISTIKFLFSLVLVIVVSIYMLLDMPRLARVVDRRFPPHPGSLPLLTRIERSLASYVRGQFLLSLIIGTSAGLGLWLLGTLGWVPGADKYAVLFGAWVAVTELIPYLGPWLGRDPAVHLRAGRAPGLGALGRRCSSSAIHQIEGHIVVPNVMGSALRLHPLLVIFGLLAGGEIYGLPGALVALPLLAAGRATWEFFAERVALESWQEGSRDTGRGRDRGDAVDGTRAAVRPARSSQPLSQGTALLAARGVARSFGRTPALQPVEFEVWDGEAVALVGPNGAGKSTLLSLLAGALEPSSGTIERRKGVRVGWAPQRPAQYGRLSARENLELFARLEGEHDPADATTRLLAEFELPGKAAPSANLSVGNRQRLNLAIALLGDPEVLLLDEPTAALDPEQRRRLWDRVAALREARRRARLRDPEPRGGRARRRPRRRAARRPPRLRRPERRVRPLAHRQSLRVNRVALLLRKDVLVLRRSPLLLGILIAYPLAIALLVGLVASYAQLEAARRVRGRGQPAGDRRRSAGSASTSTARSTRRART